MNVQVCVDMKKQEGALVYYCFVSLFVYSFELESLPAPMDAPVSLAHDTKAQ